MFGLFPQQISKKNACSFIPGYHFSHFQIYVKHQKNVIRRNISFLTTRMAAVQVFDGKNLGKEWIEDWVRRAAMKPWGRGEIQKNQPANRHVLKTTSPRRFKFQLEKLVNWLWIYRYFTGDCFFFRFCWITVNSQLGVTI